MELTDNEIKIIEIIRELQWGDVVIKVKDNIPVMISTKQDIKLDTT